MSDHTRQDKRFYIVNKTTAEKTKRTTIREARILANVVLKQT